MVQILLLKALKGCCHDQREIMRIGIHSLSDDIPVGDSAPAAGGSCLPEEGILLSVNRSKKEVHMKKIFTCFSVTLVVAGLLYVQAGQSLETASQLSGFNLAKDQEAEKHKIAQVISAVIGWAKDKNLDLLYSVIAQDDDYISVSPTNRVVKRFEDVKQNVPFWVSPDFKYVRHELKDLEIIFARCGEVAWFYCVLDDINTYKGAPASWENARWTGVVEKRDGRWVVVQQHFSFAVKG